MAKKQPETHDISCQDQTGKSVRVPVKTLYRQGQWAVHLEETVDLGRKLLSYDVTHIPSGMWVWGTEIKGYAIALVDELHAKHPEDLSDVPFGGHAPDGGDALAHTLASWAKRHRPKTKARR